MPTEIYYKVDFNVSIHGTVGGTGSEMVVGIGVKISQYFIVAHVNTRALRYIMCIGYIMKTLVGALTPLHKWNHV